MHVCVLGAGIAGLASAYRLLREGHRVTVVDGQSVAAGASAGNGGQLSYAYVQPLADPAIWRQLPHLLLSRDSPLTVRLRLDPLQWRWGWDFLRACHRAQSQASTAQLLAIARASREAFDAMRADEGIAADFRANGKVVVYRDEHSFATAREQMDFQRLLGGPEQHALGPSDLLAVEPALANAAGRLVGAIYTPGECVADCHAVCEQLARRLASHGVRLVLGHRVSGFRVERDRAVAARVAQEEIEADAFVIAAGTGSAPLARSLGLRLRVYPLKGYSVTLDIAQADRAPQASITDAAHKIVLARVGSRLRVAGRAELVGEDLSIAASRVAALADAAQELFPGACDLANLRPWAGLRPATPTGLPIVGQLPRSPANLWFNTGHGALGFTLAFGTAARLAQLLTAPRRGPRAVPAAPVARRA